MFFMEVTNLTRLAVNANGVGEDDCDLWAWRLSWYSIPCLSETRREIYFPGVKTEGVCWVPAARTMGESFSSLL
jgi:hypothetical protein